MTAKMFGRNFGTAIRAQTTQWVPTYALVKASEEAAPAPVKVGRVRADAITMVADHPQPESRVYRTDAATG